MMMKRFQNKNSNDVNYETQHKNGSMTIMSIMRHNIKMGKWQVYDGDKYYESDSVQ